MVQNLFSVQAPIEVGEEWPIAAPGVLVNRQKHGQLPVRSLKTRILRFNREMKFAKTVQKNPTRGQSNLTKSASRGAHSPVMGHPRGSKVVPLNS